MNKTQEGNIHNAIQVVKWQGWYLKSDLFDQDINHYVILPPSRKVSLHEGSLRSFPCSVTPCLTLLLLSFSLL